ncbi:protein EXORDIUM-like 4 [Gossypium arboreum]|uniref:protein EXORDIUM-like 4 n=1 Tax=Gossypium arboreum TaxID=29729 RepID=UPI000819295F|nr:protein EXORDIUM-like 4 [Gossypium arboreum]
MASFFSICLVSLNLLFLLCFIPSICYGATFDPFTEKTKITYHDGPILIGTVNLHLIWYGKPKEIQREVIMDFLKTLNTEGDKKVQPHVSRWWNVVESYQLDMKGKPTIGVESPKIEVKVAKEDTIDYAYGKVLTTQYDIPRLIKDVNHGDPNLVPLIITAKDVSMHGLCAGQCADYGIFENNRGFIVIRDPEIECPGARGWPFHEVYAGPKGPVFKPPNKNIAADAMLVKAFSVPEPPLETLARHTMTNTHGKKTLVPASKKCKGAASSSGPTNEIGTHSSNFHQDPKRNYSRYYKPDP